VAGQARPGIDQLLDGEVLRRGDWSRRAWRLVFRSSAISKASSGLPTFIAPLADHQK